MIDQTQLRHVLLDFSEDIPVSARTRVSLLSTIHTTARPTVLTTVAANAVIFENASFVLAGSAMSDQKANDSWDVDYFDEFSYYNDSQDYANDTYYSQHMMPWPQRASWIIVFTVMLLVATIGNALVTWIVLAHRRMKTVTNYFLVNLSLADLTMSLFNCVFNFVFMLNSHWPFGEFYCTVSNFIANVTVAASVFTLVAISFDRFIAIVYPLRPRMSKCIARIAITIIWLASFILATPCLLYSRLLPHSYPDGGTRLACIMIWPDGLPNVSRQDFIYNIIFTVLTYLIPVCVMAICYSRMSYILWRSESIGELSQRQAESIQSKRKVVRMFIVVVMLFAICWLPYHGYFVYQYIDHHVISYKYVQHIFLAFYWLAMSNAMINPLVYYYMNARFRQYFKTVIFQRPCYGRRSSATATDIAGAAGRLVHGAHPRSSAEHSVPPGRSQHSSTASRALRHNRGYSPIRRNHPQIIRFNTRRLVIFQRISRQNINQPLDIPLAHHTSVLVTNGTANTSVATCNISRNCVSKENSTAVITANGHNKGDLMSESSPTNNTSLALSYL